jgi:hypothetical protein
METNVVSLRSQRLKRFGFICGIAVGISLAGVITQLFILKKNFDGSKLGFLSSLGSFFLYFVISTAFLTICAVVYECNRKVCVTKDGKLKKDLTSPVMENQDQITGRRTAILNAILKEENKASIKKKLGINDNSHDKNIMKHENWTVEYCELNKQTKHTERRDNNIYKSYFIRYVAVGTFQNRIIELNGKDDLLSLSGRSNNNDILAYEKSVTIDTDFQDIKSNGFKR